jgi:hypothetical protein
VSSSVCAEREREGELGNVLAEDLLPGGGGKEVEHLKESEQSRRGCCVRERVGHRRRGQKKKKMAWRANFCMGARR